MRAVAAVAVLLAGAAASLAPGSTGAPSAAAAPVVPAVVGGRPADAGEWPWQVALRFEGQQFCGGTLVGPAHVLTAAHCTDPFAPADIEVLAGTVDLRRGGVSRAVATIHQHEQWDDFNLRFDIALLELSEPFELGDGIGLVTLATDAQVEALGAAGSPLVVIGFGATDEFDDGSPVLLEGDVAAVDDTQCLDLYREQAVAVYGEMQLCAVGPGGSVDACFGDSGGPLLAPVDAERTRWVQLGVASWNHRCGRFGLPTVYTQVPAFFDWLVERGVPLARGQEFEAPGARIPARGTVGKAGRYPLTLDVAGFEGELTSVSVRLRGLTHPRSADLDMRLVAPDGTTVTLLSDAGGNGRLQAADVLVLAAAGPRAAGEELGAVVGPTDHDPDPQWAELGAPADLGRFAGVDPNGRWQLLVADDQNGASGELASWVLVLG